MWGWGNSCGGGSETVDERWARSAPEFVQITANLVPSLFITNGPREPSMYRENISN